MTQAFFDSATLTKSSTIGKNKNAVDNHEEMVYHFTRIQ
jgi:hypothetical protein